MHLTIAWLVVFLDKMIPRMGLIVLALLIVLAAQTLSRLAEDKSDQKGPVESGSASLVARCPTLRTYQDQEPPVPVVVQSPDNIVILRQTPLRDETLPVDGVETLSSALVSPPAVDTVKPPSSDPHVGVEGGAESDHPPALSRMASAPFCVDRRPQALDGVSSPRDKLPASSPGLDMEFLLAVARSPFLGVDYGRQALDDVSVPDNQTPSPNKVPPVRKAGLRSFEKKGGVESQYSLSRMRSASYWNDQDSQTLAHGNGDGVSISDQTPSRDEVLAVAVDAIQLPSSNREEGVEAKRSLPTTTQYHPIGTSHNQQALDDVSILDQATPLAGDEVGPCSSDPGLDEAEMECSLPVPLSQFTQAPDGGSILDRTPPFNEVLPVNKVVEARSSDPDFNEERVEADCSSSMVRSLPIGTSQSSQVLDEKEQAKPESPSSVTPSPPISQDPQTLNNVSTARVHTSTGVDPVSKEITPASALVEGRELPQKTVSLDSDLSGSDSLQSFNANNSNSNEHINLLAPLRMQASIRTCLQILSNSISISTSCIPSNDITSPTPNSRFHLPHSTSYPLLTSRKPKKRRQTLGSDRDQDGNWRRNLVEGASYDNPILVV